MIRLAPVAPVYYNVLLGSAAMVFAILLTLLLPASLSAETTASRRHRRRWGSEGKIADQRGVIGEGNVGDVEMGDLEFRAVEDEIQLPFRGPAGVGRFFLRVGADQTGGAENSSSSRIPQRTLKSPARIIGRSTWRISRYSRSS